MKRRVSRLLSLLLALCMALALLPGTALAADGPAESVSSSAFGMWASTVKSYLYENESGGLTRVEYIQGQLLGETQVVAEEYSSGFVFQRGWSLPIELDLWGGFFAGETYNFLVFGQKNPDEDDNREVIRVVKYSKDWQRLGQASLYGANTVTPFQSGTLRAAEYDGMLYIRTCHTMYASSDGLNHQANLTMAVRESDMTVTNSNDLDYYGGSTATGYVSHSFNQFILIDGERHIVALDHGDSYPRGAALTVFPNTADTKNITDGYAKRVMIQEIPGTAGENRTGAFLGGLAETSSGYVVAYHYDGKGSSGTVADRSVYFAYVDKNSLNVTTKVISDAGSWPPVLAPTSLNGGYILWNAYNPSWSGDIETFYRHLCYMPYSDGGNVGTVKTAIAPLSDCQPIVYNGKVVWYTTGRQAGNAMYKSAPTFYQLDENGVTFITADGIHITVNDTPVGWTDAEPFIDKNSRTMVPLRAVADAMRLDVSWNAAAREASFTDGKKTITFPIGSPAARTSDGRTIQMDTAAVIVSDRTYAPVRYLAEYFGYTVGWDTATRTVVITG